ncbi:hypothetical protein CDL15_Pgr003205 [Punica granatum]|uniref:Mediator of RNA polymerase II transcription subunit 27 n=1 Tax=Punica granatum TaxID=22663 RepID=A0A218X276_PUNGR|nr:hypothetical protein CDL15_Pgr003205 [Punica granatum]
MQHQALPQPVSISSPPPSSESRAAEAPPMQVALAMDRLSQAARLIADIRLGADRLLEALFVASQPHQSTKPLQFFAKEDASMRQHLQDLRSIGKQLEETGVINESLRSRSNSWGLHMPLVCPDGAVVAYAWKRQLAGQAGASAVDRARLAFKAFSDQKRRFFPHLEDSPSDQSGESVSKRRRVSVSHEDDATDYKTLSDVLAQLEKEAPNVKVFTYDRLDWLKRAALLPASANENPMEVSKEQSFHSLNRLGPDSVGAVATDKVAVIELLFPSVFRAIVSLHPAGSIDPDAVAFFSPDEEHAAMALQYFLGVKADTALYSILVESQCLNVVMHLNFVDPVSFKCGRLLAMDKQSAVLLPPVHRLYRTISTTKVSSTQLVSSTKDQSHPSSQAYHAGCYSKET